MLITYIADGINDNEHKPRSQHMLACIHYMHTYTRGWTNATCGLCADEWRPQQPPAHPVVHRHKSVVVGEVAGASRAVRENGLEEGNLHLHLEMPGSHTELLLVACTTHARTHRTRSSSYLAIARQMYIITDMLSLDRLRR